MVLTSGEETGCTGAVKIPAAELARGGPLVVAEPTQNRLVPGHKGAHWMRLTAAGKAAHGSAPELGDNAAVKVARAAVALHDYSEWPTDPRFGPVTANVGVLRGGVQPNVVPDAAELLLDVRTVPAFSGDRVRELVGLVAGGDVRVADHVVLPPVDTDPRRRVRRSGGGVPRRGGRPGRAGRAGPLLHGRLRVGHPARRQRCDTGARGRCRARRAGPVPRRQRVVLAESRRRGGRDLRRAAAPLVRGQWHRLEP